MQKTSSLLLKVIPLVSALDNSVHKVDQNKSVNRCIQCAFSAAVQKRLDTSSTFPVILLDIFHRGSQSRILHNKGGCVYCFNLSFFIVCDKIVV